MASTTNQSMAGPENVSMAQMRVMAMLQRRSMPPRCNPITIVLLVLAFGLMFIGLTMTVIAHWPGSSSIGENPLKIAGPILLCFGFIGVVVMLIITCYINTREKKKWMQSVNNLAASRLTINQSYTSLSGVHHKQQPKADPYNQSGPRYDSVDIEGNYRHPQNYPTANDSQDSALIEKQNYLHQYNEELNQQSPQPLLLNTEDTQRNRVDQDDLPEPVRITRKSQQHRKHVEQETEVVNGSDMHSGYPTSAQMMHHYDETEPYPTAPNDEEKKKKKKKKSKGKKSKVQRSDAAEAPAAETAALMNDVPVSHRRHSGDDGPPMYSDAMYGADTNIDSPSDGEGQPAEYYGARAHVPDSPRLRIELRVPSGSKINISQGEEKPFRPPVAPKPKRDHNKSSSSLETNI